MDVAAVLAQQQQNNKCSKSLTLSLSLPLSISLAVVPITFCKLHTHSRLYKPYQSVQSADPQQTLQTLSVCSNGRPTADFTNPISLFNFHTHRRLYKPYQFVQIPHPPQTLQTLSVCSNGTPTADFTNPISLFKPRHPQVRLESSPRKAVIYPSAAPLWEAQMLCWLAFGEHEALKRYSKRLHSCERLGASGTVWRRLEASRGA